MEEASKIMKICQGLQVEASRGLMRTCAEFWHPCAHRFGQRLHSAHCAELCAVLPTDATLSAQHSQSHFPTGPILLVGHCRPIFYPWASYQVLTTSYWTWLPQLYTASALRLIWDCHCLRLSPWQPSRGSVF